MVPVLLLVVGGYSCLLSPQKSAGVPNASKIHPKASSSSVTNFAPLQLQKPHLLLPWHQLPRHAGSQLEQLRDSCDIRHSRGVSSHALWDNGPQAYKVQLDFRTSTTALGAHNFTMPALSPTMTEGNITTWKVKEGMRLPPLIRQLSEL